MLTILSMHLIQQDKNPTFNAISEYVTGRYGGLMTSTFFAQTIASISVGILAFRLRPKSNKARIAGILFILAGLGDVLAGLFQTDPTSQTNFTTTGAIHMAGGITRFVSLAVALPLLSAVMRKNDHLQGRTTALNVLGNLFVLAFLITLFILAPAGLFGLGQRLFIAIALTWMMIYGKLMMDY